MKTASGSRICADRALSDPHLRPDVLLVAGGLCVGDIPAFLTSNVSRGRVIVSLSAGV